MILSRSPVSNLSIRLEKCLGYKMKFGHRRKEYFFKNLRSCSFKACFLERYNIEQARVCFSCHGRSCLFTCTQYANLLVSSICVCETLDKIVGNFVWHCMIDRAMHMVGWDINYKPIMLFMDSSKPFAKHGIVK